VAMTIVLPLGDGRALGTAMGLGEVRYAKVVVQYV